MLIKINEANLRRESGGYCNCQRNFKCHRSPRGSVTQSQHSVTVADIGARNV
jgi:hypothetical protein